MRPVNLIPPEERPGSRKPLRSGPLAYILVGALAAAVVAIVVLVTLENSISDKKAEVTKLQAEQTKITAEAQALSAYTQFSSVREQRLATVTELANSRFDWARILHELSLVIPADVHLTSLSGNAAPGVGAAGGAGVGLRSQIAGPALEMTGCASGHAGVADFIEAVKAIDGVTRVGIQGSSMTGGAGGGGNATSAEGCSGDAAQFQLVAAFDAAPVPAVETGEAVAPEAAAPEATEEGGGETASSESTETITAEGSSEEAAAQ
jgi:Tfp pilus assembly protein PilN